MSSAPRVSDPMQWGYSLENVIELLSGCLEAVPAKSILEVGAFQGELTRELLIWATENGARVTTIEPLPNVPLKQVMADYPELEVLEETSHDALRSLESLPDAMVIDGDHNYYTLFNELKIIGEKTGGDLYPLTMFHDVGWPHARRDTYYAPDRIPEEHRQPLAHDMGLAPGNPGVTRDGLPYEWAAAAEGGPGNGVLTAIEDYMAEHADLRFAVIPVFFGFGILWSDQAPYAAEVASLVEAWDRNPILERLEGNRVFHLVKNHAMAQRIQELSERNARQEQLLRDMLESSAIGAAEKLSRLRQKGDPIFSKERIRAVLED